MPLCAGLCAGCRRDTQRISPNCCHGETLVCWAKRSCDEAIMPTRAGQGPAGLPVPGGPQPASSIPLEQREAGLCARRKHRLPPALCPLAPLGLGQFPMGQVSPAGSPRPHEPLPSPHPEAAKGSSGLVTCATSCTGGRIKWNHPPKRKRPCCSP